MGPKKASTGTAATKDTKDKKAAAAPSHPSYKGELLIANWSDSTQVASGININHLLTGFFRYDQGGHSQCKPISNAPDHAVDPRLPRCRCRKTWQFPTMLFHAFKL
jgi:hypothetical protein